MSIKQYDSNKKPTDSNVGILIASLIISLCLAGYLIITAPTQNEVITKDGNPINDQQTTGTIKK